MRMERSKRDLEQSRAKHAVFIQKHHERMAYCQRVSDSISEKCESIQEGIASFKEGLKELREERSSLAEDLFNTLMDHPKTAHLAEAFRAELSSLCPKIPPPSTPTSSSTPTTSSNASTPAPTSSLLVEPSESQ
eukprot:TRINITY_DN10207_c0_g1_i3.p1 TRINITY_DN10207_c0_g1~~TRINITY_DN10207_c0_g1_i3.p1  ORF type:complete len:134 (+),score=40.08 TRINITY_DN10207_c0_g1_i3:261-662(+)